jgi:hypothetical protein
MDTVNVIETAKILYDVYRNSGEKYWYELRAEEMERWYRIATLFIKLKG